MPADAPRFWTRLPTSGHPEFLVNTSYRDYRDNLQLVSGAALGRFAPLSVGADGKTARAWAEIVVFAPGLNFSVFLKTTGDPLRITAVLRREALALNQDAVFSTRLLADATTGSLFAQRVAASLLGVVGGISLLLAPSACTAS